MRRVRRSGRARLKGNGTIPSDRKRNRRAQGRRNREKIASASSIASSTSAPPSLDGKRVAAPQTSVASQPSQDASVWSGLLLAHLSRFKRYPALAVRQQRQGIVQVAVTLDRQGNVLGVKLLRSSGVASLDRGGASVTAARFSTACTRQRDRSGAGGIQRDHSDSFRSA